MGGVGYIINIIILLWVGGWGVGGVSDRHINLCLCLLRFYGLEVLRFGGLDVWRFAMLFAGGEWSGVCGQRKPLGFIFLWGWWYIIRQCWVNQIMPVVLAESHLKSLRVELFFVLTSICGLSK